jgi:hypothetical protein
MKRLIDKIMFFIYGDDSLIKKEGWEILNDPIKKVKLREMIDNYHKTGSWDFSIMD